MSGSQLTLTASEKPTVRQAEYYTVLSFGAGVQTTYMLLSEPQRYDEIIFADTGGEWPETYAYIETIVKPFCRKHNLKFTTVYGERKIDKVEGQEYNEDASNKVSIHNLETYSLAHKIAPSSMDRWCTHIFKIEAIQKYLNALNLQIPIVCAIGYSHDEAKRMNEGDKVYESYQRIYPLIDQQITRKDCEAGIRKLGYPVPQKSGCFYCPYQKKKQWIRLYHEHPELYNRAENIDKQNGSYPNYSICSIKDKFGERVTLERLAIRLGRGSAKLDEYMDDSDLVDTCESGHCMR